MIITFDAYGTLINTQPFYDQIVKLCQSKVIDPQPIKYTYQFG